MYGTGISREGDVLDCAAQANIIDKAGAWYSYKGERIGQGRENVKKYLFEHPEILAEVEAQLKKEYIPENMKVDEDGVIIE